MLFRSYSQPKLELYGLFRALRAYRLYLVGVRNLHVEVDAKYIKGMLNEPDLQPNATINRWIQGLLLFDFTLIHVPAHHHKGPDALSRREPLEDEFSSHEDDDEWLDRIALYGPISPDTSRINKASAESYPIHLPDPRSPKDQVLEDIFHFLKTLETPAHVDSRQKLRRFIQKASKFFVQAGVMFKCNGSGSPLKVIRDPKARSCIL